MSVILIYYKGIIFPVNNQNLILCIQIVLSSCTPYFEVQKPTKFTYFFAQKRTKCLKEAVLKDKASGDWLTSR